MPDRRLRIEIQGIVQGVGFRPFVYRLARDLGLRGWVANDARGVVIEAEGSAGDLERLLARLPAEIPPGAAIHSLVPAWLEPAGLGSFMILESREGGEGGTKTASIQADLAVCADCLSELFDPTDRRHRYPFTNCTRCGPRFSIIEALPYDRPNTTMRGFRMCGACRAEYDDPADRRFHAQPNACPVCGPRLALWSPGGETLAVDDEALQAAATALLDGRVVAVKGLGGFHLMADARDDRAVAALRRGKKRRDRPFAIMAADLGAARRLCDLSEDEAALLGAPEAPIVLAARRDGGGVSDGVAPGVPTLGVMLPATPLHHLIMREAAAPMVATSGNLGDEPICTDEREALARLAGIADLFLVNDRPIARHVDDSIARRMRGRTVLLRRARGWAPLPVMAPQVSPPTVVPMVAPMVAPMVSPMAGSMAGSMARPMAAPGPPPAVLAVGAHLKSTVALSVGSRVVMSQHLGDLETPEAFAAFTRAIADLMRLHEARPVAVAHDLHPGYPSTRWAEQAVAGRVARDLGLEGARLIPVQHHHAHLASCLAEAGAAGASVAREDGATALGVAWDGTGYGLDATIWGGEFLRGGAAGFTRVASLRPFRLPGGEAAIREPRRVALALLWEMMGEAAFGREDLPPVRTLGAEARRVLAAMLARGVNAPIATSAGRLFDGVAALIGLRQEVSFEGQAAMALEAIADPAVGGVWPMPLAGGALDWRPAIEAVIDEQRAGVAREVLAARFHNTLAEGILAVARSAGERRVALTGGCFQNRLLLERAAARLEADGFEVLMHHRVPPNDGGISLGQVMVAAARLTAEKAKDPAA